MATARSIALIGIAIVIAGLIAMLAFLRTRKEPSDEASSIRARYGHMIVPVGHVTQPAGTSVIDVADMEALVRIAEHYDRSILHEATGGGEAFWVTDESGQFRYTVGAPVPAGTQPSFAAESEPSPYTVSAPAFIAAQPAGAAASQQADYTVSSPAFAAHQPTAEPSTLEFPASNPYADELQLGGAISAFEAQAVPEPVVPETAASGGWAARDLADALTQDNLSWPDEDELVDVGRARAGAFARIAGLH